MDIQEQIADLRELANMQDTQGEHMRLFSHVATLEALNKVYVAAIRVSDKAMLTEGGIGALDELQKGDLWNAIAEVKALTDTESIAKNLIDNAVELDPDAKRALYKDRHELYDTADSRQTSEFSRFIREGTPEEKSEVFGRVIESAIKDQKDVVDNTQDSAIVDYSDCDFDDSSQELVGEDENCVRFNPNGTATNFGKPIIDTTADSKRKQCRHGLILYGDRCLNCEREDAVAESGHGS